MLRLQGLPQKSIVSPRFIIHIVYMSLCYRTVTGTTNHWKCQQAHSGIVSGRQELGQARTLARRQCKKTGPPGILSDPRESLSLSLKSWWFSFVLPFQPSAEQQGKCRQQEGQKRRSKVQHHRAVVPGSCAVPGRRDRRILVVLKADFADLARQDLAGSARVRVSVCSFAGSRFIMVS